MSSMSDDSVVDSVNSAAHEFNKHSEDILMSSSTDAHGHNHEDCCHSCFWSMFLSIFLILVILFKFKNPLQYYVKYAIYVFIVMSSSLVFIPIMMFRPGNTANIAMVARVYRYLFKIYQIKVTLENSKYFQSNQPYIIITNHQSSLDFLTMMNIWPANNCTPLAKKELLFAGPFGLGIWLAGITFIDRLNHEKARGTIDNLAERINKENLRIWIYPEGTRSPRTELLPFKKGAFYLAVQAQVPIVCVVTSSYLNFYSKKEKKFLPNGEIKVRVLPPFQTRGMTQDSVSQLTKHLQEIMQKEYEKLNEEINLEKKYFTHKKSTDNLETSNNLNSSSGNLINNDLEDLIETDEINASLIEDEIKKDINKSGILLNDDNNNSINEDDSFKKVN